MADGSVGDIEAWSVPAPGSVGPIVCPACKAPQPESDRRDSACMRCDECGAREDPAAPDTRKTLDGGRVRDLEELVAENARLRNGLDMVMWLLAVRTIERDMLARALAVVVEDATQTEARLRERIAKLRWFILTIARGMWCADEPTVTQAKFLLEWDDEMRGEPEP